jgi:threonyl-tRNA synthetase
LRPKRRCTKVSEKHVKLIAHLEFPKRPIKITLPDGTVKEGMSFETSPYDIAKGISKQMADKIIVAKIKYSTRVATLDDGLLNPEAEEGVTAAD